LKILKTNKLTESQKQYARALWNKEYPKTLFHDTQKVSMPIWVF